MRLIGISSSVVSAHELADPGCDFAFKPRTVEDDGDTSEGKIRGKRQEVKGKGLDMLAKVIRCMDNYCYEIRKQTPKFEEATYKLTFIYRESEIAVHTK